MNDEDSQTGQTSEVGRKAVSESRICPQCGGLPWHLRRDMSAFNTVTLAVFVVLAPFAFHTCITYGSLSLGILFLSCAVAALLLLWGLPAAAATAFETRLRCRRCGSPLPTSSETGDATEEARFPCRFGLAGSAILLVFLAVGLTWVMTAPGHETWEAGRIQFGRIVLAILALALGVFVQVGLWQILQVRARRPRRLDYLLLLPPLVLGAAWLGLTAHDHRVFTKKFDPVVRAPGVLGRAGLGDLPVSARDVQIHSWAFLMSGKHTLRFAAEPNDIEAFLASSPSLEGVACQTYSSERMRLPARTHADISGRSPEGGHDYFDPRTPVPRWYQQEIRGSGRRYEINWRDGMYQGELLIDDERHIVYVRVVRY